MKKIPILRPGKFIFIFCILTLYVFQGCTTTRSKTKQKKVQWLLLESKEEKAKRKFREKYIERPRGGMGGHAHPPIELEKNKDWHVEFRKANKGKHLLRDFDKHLEKFKKKKRKKKKR